MRASPTINLSSGSTIGVDVEFVGSGTMTPTFDNQTAYTMRAYGTISGTSGTVGNPTVCTSSTIQASAEL
jgi:hypothetical protein